MNLGQLLSTVVKTSLVFFHFQDALDSYEIFSSEIFEVLLTAKSLLIASIQKIAMEGRQNLEFEYIIK